MTAASIARWEWRTYGRSLQPPLHTQHGLWQRREGIVLRLVDEQGRVGYGEIAPIPWFGSETIAQAIAFCQSLPAAIAHSHLPTIPDHLPACQFGFESAWATLEAPENPPDLPPDRLCALLPTGAIALDAWAELWARGHRTFKWKIGVAELPTELAWFEQLMTALPSGAAVRLDANGGLSVAAAATWLAATHGTAVEFLEQPLPPAQFAELMQLQAQGKTAIALDESVATLAQLQQCYRQGWRGIYVLKPAIAGSPRRLRQVCQAQPLDLVFSSALETEIGRQAGLRLALDLGNPARALGYGTAHWFTAIASPAPTHPEQFEQLWQTL